MEAPGGYLFHLHKKDTERKGECGMTSLWLHFMHTLVVCSLTIDPVYSVTLSVSNLVKSLGMLSHTTWSALYSTLAFLFYIFPFLGGPY